MSSRTLVSSGYAPDCNPTAALNVLSSDIHIWTHMHGSHIVQDAQEAKKGKKKKKRKGKKGEDKGKEEESPATDAPAELSSPQDSRDGSADGQSAAIIKDSSPEAQPASKSLEPKGQAMLYSARKANVNTVDTCSEASKAPASNHSMSRGEANGDASVVAKGDGHAMHLPVRANQEGKSKEGDANPHAHPNHGRSREGRPGRSSKLRQGERGVGAAARPE